MADEGTKLDVTHGSSLYSWSPRPVKILTLKGTKRHTGKICSSHLYKWLVLGVYRSNKQNPSWEESSSHLCAKPRHTLLLPSRPSALFLGSQPRTVKSQELITAHHGWDSMPACSFSCYIRSRDIKQQWVIFFTRLLPLLLLGENTWTKAASEDYKGRTPESAGSPGLGADYSHLH